MRAEAACRLNAKDAKDLAEERREEDRVFLSSALLCEILCVLCVKATVPEPEPSVGTSPGDVSCPSRIAFSSRSFASRFFDGTTVTFSCTSVHPIAVFQKKEAAARASFSPTHAQPPLTDRLQVRSLARPSLSLDLPALLPVLSSLTWGQDNAEPNIVDPAVRVVGVAKR